MILEGVAVLVYLKHLQNIKVPDYQVPECLETTP
jgi:hypothetical protein